jgi:hypothetical protein
MTTLEIIDEIQKLSEPEIREFLSKLSEDFTDFEKEDLLIQQSMLRAGLITAIRFPRRKTMENVPPAPIKGKPLSETIIEERG